MESCKAGDVVSTLMAMENPRQREILQRFFKTGKGQYGEGDVFLGIKVPQTRLVVKEAKLRIPLAEIESLLASSYHEVRLCGFLLLVEAMKAATPRRGKAPVAEARRRKEIVDFYLANARKANNWDLVDLSAPGVVGSYLLYPTETGDMPSRDVLDRLALSENLWEQRIAVVATVALIRDGQFDDTLRIGTKLLDHPHDLIRKAIGWMLREIGKKDQGVLEDYLEENYSKMARTTLRYAIERMAEPRRQYWLKR